MGLFKPERSDKIGKQCTRCSARTFLLGGAQSHCGKTADRRSPF